MPDTPNDVFLSYDPADVDRVEQLAAGLRTAGFGVFLDRWEIDPGDLVVPVLESGISGCGCGIVVMSKRFTSNSWAVETYAALAKRALDGSLERLVPVVLDHGVELPSLLDSRAPFSFAGVVDPDTFQTRIERLATELRGVRGRNPIDLVLGVDPDDARLRDTPALTKLQINATTTTLIKEDGTEERAEHTGVTAELRHALWTAERARRTVTRTTQSPWTSRSVSDLDGASRQLGAKLADAFLPSPLNRALSTVLATIQRSGRVAHLAFEFPGGEDELIDLPWESLVLPGDTTPVGLNPAVQVYRHFGGLGATSVRLIPGPLRILAVIASPDSGDAELLDYEYELASILDQVQAARAARTAHVRILNWGSLQTIRDALTQEDFHVLHVSCHASEGLLHLEKPDGTADTVDARRFVAELRFPQNMPPLVVLAGSRTGRAGRETGLDTDSETPLPAYARELISRGVPSVIAMSTDVSNAYATQLLSRTYHELATHRDGPDVLHAISAARQTVEQDRKSLPVDDPRGAMAEWTAAALYQRVRHNLLFDPASPDGPVVVPDRTMLPRSIVDLDVGDFVGRRPDLRALRRQLIGPGGAKQGVLIHGMGGVGKSSLATQLVRMLGERTVIVAVHGPHTVDQLLSRLADTLYRWFDRRRGTDQNLDDVADESRPWRDRLALLDELVLPTLDRVEVVLLLDDPLGDPLETGPGQWPPERTELEPDLRDFLPAWLTVRGTKLVMTCRTQLDLAGGSRFATHHLGPLSPAETRKLVFRLPAIDQLPPAARHRVLTAVGGHPRALEYLDAVLSGEHRHTVRRYSDARFDTIVDKIDRALARRGRDATTLRAAGTGIESAMAETAALVSADVLLHELFTGLAAFKPARALLVNVSVHRQPIDERGLRWSTGDPVADPARVARLETAYRLLVAAERDGSAQSRAELPLSRDAHEQLNRDLAVAKLPPDASWLREATDRLTRLTLLTPIPSAGTAADQTNYLVHRWTALSLVEMADPGDLVTAHRRAAGYHRWQAHLWRDVPDAHLRELEEVRYHCTEAGDQEEALAVTAQMCAVLDLRGAHAWEWELCHQALRELRDDDVRSRVFRHRQSVVSMRRGGYADAERHQIAAQNLAGAAGDKVAIAAGLQQLGTIAHLQGDVATAEQRYREAVRAVGEEEIKERLDARIILAGCYQRLGGIALGRSDEEDATRFSFGAIEVAGEIGVETDIATIHRDLAELAGACGDQASADMHQTRARYADAAHDDVRRLVVAASLQLGAVSLTQHTFDKAQFYLAPIQELAEQVGDERLLAACEQLRGETQLHLGDAPAARLTYQRFVDLAEDLGDEQGVIVAHQQLGRIASMLGEPAVAMTELHTAMKRAKAFGADVLVAATNLVLGGVLVAQGRSDEAADEFAAGLRTAEAVGQDGLAMGCVIQLALTCMRQGGADRAAELFADGYSRAKELNSRRGMAVCRLAMAIMARQLDDPTAAMRWNGEALAIAEEEGNPRLVAECLARNGDLALDRGRIAAAAEAYAQCLDVLSTLNATELRAQVLRQLARCDADEGDYEEAVGTLTEAVGEFSVLSDDEGELACVIRLAWALPRTGRTHSARRAMRRAGELAAGRRASPAVVVGLLIAAEEALAGADIEAAQTSAEDARNAARAIGDGTLVVDSLQVLAAIAVRRSALGDACSLLESGLGIATAQQDHIVAAHLHRQLGVVYAEAGDEQLALQHFTRSAALAAKSGLGNALEAANRLLGETGDNVADLIAEADDDFTHVLWLRRLRAVDGETAFTEQVVTYIGPSIDDVVRDLVPAFSGVSSVPAVVSPVTTVRVH